MGENFYEQYEVLDDASITDSNAFKWDSENTKYFLNCYLEKKDEFRDPKKKKRKLWSEIMHTMVASDIPIENADTLDRKMRNMKKTYKTIKDNNNKKSTTGRGRISWEFFDIFEEIFADDATINVSGTLSSMQSQNNNFSNDGSEASIDLSTNEASTNDELDVGPSTSSGRKRKSSLNYYRAKQLAFEEKKIKIIDDVNVELRKIREAMKKKIAYSKKF